jgi:type IV pilus assembly protein PilY1
MTRTRLRILTSLAAVAALSAIHHEAGAQAGTTEYAPSDVLLLLDTSGSMAYTTVRSPEDATRYGLPRCGPSTGPSYPASGSVSFDAAASFTAGQPSPADRWAILVNAFTGSIQAPECASQDRSTDAFVDEFRLGASPTAGDTPYDRGYYLPFNRIVATRTVGGVTQRCTPAPSWDDTLRSTFYGSSGNAMKWPDTAPVYWRDLDQDFYPGTPCPFDPQDTDGVIDRLQSSVRFGIMTFDPTPLRADTGTIGTGMLSTFVPDYPSGIGDTWSYFSGWLGYPGSGTPTQGWPANCAPESGVPRWYEVGARNPAAPPWEGRLIGFGNPVASTEEIISNNDRVQQAILGMRPFGGTPVAGMLADAFHFLTEDDTEPSDVGGAEFYGGRVDPNVWTADRSQRGCRKRIAILITDGGPNLDLQPHCHPEPTDNPAGDGRCPYRTPQDYAQDLYEHNIDLFVVGFSVTAANQGTTLTCNQLMDPNDPAHRDCSSLPACTGTCGVNSCAYGYCISNPSDELLAVCCNIEAIANAGSRYTAEDDGMTVGAPRSAYWAESGSALVTAVSNILRFPSAAMTRTQPVFATGNSSAMSVSDTMVGARFFSSFDPVSKDLYAGHLVRERYECAPDPNQTGNVATEVAISSDEGDYFEVNVDGEGPSFANRSLRNIYTVLADEDPTQAGVIYSARSVRPMLPVGVNPDGLGDVRGTTVSGTPSTFISGVTPGALFGTNPCTSSAQLCCPRLTPNSVPSAAECRTRFLRLQLGFDNPTDTESQYVRASAFGAMINSTPEVVMPPSEFLRDGSYQVFQNIFSDRVPTIYAATADGQVHAFAINKEDNELNELWAFMPPAVLPSIGGQFPTRFEAANRTLISGPLVTSEVAGDEAADPATGRFLTRTAPDPEDPNGAKWYSVLLGTFGASQGYFAMDITNPDPTSDKSAHGYGAGPRFLWQLTTDEDGNPLFGSRSTRPAVATLYFVMPGSGAGATPARHAVAILPGGYGGVRSTTATEETVFPTGSVADMDVTHRTLTARYTPVDATSTRDKLSLAGARSLTIVRLDTGEVIRTFRRSATYDAADPQAPEGLYTQGRVSTAPFAAPLVGHIVSYPNTPGTVADRAYVGDAEGRLWRIDLSSAEPEDWSVSLFHDAFPSAGPGGGTFSLEDVGPIETPPILSTDPVGRVTVAVSTGEQSALTPVGRHSVWSLTEQRNINTGELAVQVNWVLNGSNARNTVPSNDGSADSTMHFSVTDQGLQTGERVTGPMALFSSVLYFTTYNPRSVEAESCSPGVSYLWGVDYVNAGETADALSTDPEDGPLPQFPNGDSTVAAENLRVINLNPGIAFGVGVMQKPSCIETTTSDDPFLGLTGHQSISSVNAGAFQLVVQVGANEGAGDKKVRVDTFDLIPPSARSQIDSWAAILD